MNGGHRRMNPLILSHAKYEEIFERITRLSLEYLASVPELPSFPEVTAGELATWFSSELSERGAGDAIFGELTKVIDGCRPNSPRFFGYVFGSGEPVAAAADLLTSVLNQNTTAWRSGPTATTLEHLVVGWLAEAIGCKGFTGSLTGGGSPANLMALAMAREARLPANERGAQPGTVYASQQVHMSIPKAVALLGIGRDHLRLIPCDRDFRVRTDALRDAIASDIAAGQTPIAIVGSAGTVATGSIDPLIELASVAREYGAWFHIDGAYGALASIAQPEKFIGLNAADSLSLDPHKWLYQPVDCGCLLYRDANAARSAFSQTGDYAQSLLDDPARKLRVLRGIDGAVAALSRIEALALAALSRTGKVSRGHSQRSRKRAILGQAHRRPSRTRVACARSFERCLFPICLKARRNGARRAESFDFAAHGSPGKGILIERESEWEIRFAGLLRQPSHDAG